MTLVILATAAAAAIALWFELEQVCLRTEIRGVVDFRVLDIWQNRCI